MESGVTERFCSLPANNTTPYSTPWNNCVPPSCGPDLISSPNCRCAYPFTGLFSFKAPSFSSLTNATIYNSLHDLLMTFFKDAGLPVDSVSLKNPSRNLDDYLVLRLEVFPSGEPSFNRTGVIGVAFALSNQTFKPSKTDFNTYTFMAENYNNFLPGLSEPGGRKHKSSNTGIIIGSLNAAILKDMGQVKYSHSRLDAKKSSCSPATVVVVLGVCLVGVWMFMSSSVIPGQNPNVPVLDSKTDSTAKVSANPSSQFEDNSGDLSEDATKDGVSQENTQDEKSSDSEGNDDNEEPASNNQDSNTKILETRTEDESSSCETETSKSKSENENGSSDTNEADKPDSEVKKVEEKVRKPEDEKKTGSFPAGDQSEILKETETDKGAFSTQAAESASEKQSQKQAESLYKWKTCNVTAGPDFIPCLDNYGALRKLRSTLHYEHRERHCPAESPTCLVALPKGYMIPIRWPRSRDQIWYNNVPRTKLAEVKGHQNWVKVTGEYLTFPGGGTQFKNGALHYIDHIQKGLERFVDLSLRCVEEQGDQRPRMSEVVKELESIMALVGLNPGSESSSSTSASYEGRGNDYSHPYSNDSLFAYSGGFLPPKLHPKKWKLIFEVLFLIWLNYVICLHSLFKCIAASLLKNSSSSVIPIGEGRRV